MVSGAVGYRRHPAYFIGSLGAGMYSKYRGYAGHSMVKHASDVANGLIPPVAGVGVKRKLSFSTPSPRPFKAKILSINKRRVRLTPTRRPKGKGLVYRTTGKLYGKVPRGKRNKKDKYAVDGSTYHYEDGGVVSDLNCCYVGFASNPIQMTLASVCRSIIKELYRQMGVQIERWDASSIGGATAGTTTTLSYFYTTDTSDRIENEVGIASALSAITPAQAADELAFSFGYTLASNPRARIRRLVVTRTMEGGYWRIATIHPDCFDFEVVSYGSMSIQNRTLSADDNAFFTDISNNPVIGKVYYGTGNYFGVREETNEGSVLTPFQGEHFDPGFAVSSAENNSSVTKKPIDGRALLNCSKTSSVVIQPGGIKYGKLSFKRWFNLQNFLTIYALPIGASISAVREVQLTQHKLGHVFMIGVEKMVNDRQSEQTVSLAWEVNLTMKCRYKYKVNVPSIPIVYEKT